MPRYRLIDAESANDLGPFASSERQWSPGDRIFYRGGELIVARLIEAEPDDDADGYLVVEVPLRAAPAIKQTERSHPDE